MWGSRHRKMVCRGCRGDGSPEGWQEAVPPGFTAHQGTASNSQLPTRHGERISRGWTGVLPRLFYARFPPRTWNASAMVDGAAGDGSHPRKTRLMQNTNARALTRTLCMGWQRPGAAPPARAPWLAKPARKRRRLQAEDRPQRDSHASPRSSPVLADDPSAASGRAHGGARTTPGCDPRSHNRGARQSRAAGVRFPR